MNRARGFTLIEMLTVVAIIAVLVGLVAAGLSMARKKARRAEVATLVKNVESAAKTFQLNYNRWPFEIDGVTLKDKLKACDVFAELSPGNTALTPCTYQPLINKQRVEYLAIPPTNIRNGSVVDVWGNPLELYWNPDTRTLVIVSAGENQKNETIDGAGNIQPATEQGDDINNL